MFLLRFIFYLLVFNLSLSRDEGILLANSVYFDTFVNQSTADNFDSQESFSVTGDINRISDFFEISEVLEDSFHEGDGGLPAGNYLKISRNATLKGLQIICNENNAPFIRFNLYIYFLQLKIPFVKG
jgi:hypothetical protein